MAVRGHFASHCCWQTPEDQKANDLTFDINIKILLYSRIYHQLTAGDCESILPTCQHMWGDFLSRMYWVSGEGSSSYLSKGSLSITMGSQSPQEKRTTGWAERGGWEEQIEMIRNIHLFDVQPWQQCITKHRRLTGNQNDRLSSQGWTPDRTMVYMTDCQIKAEKTERKRN